jgi:hypothetical protein
MQAPVASAAIDRSQGGVTEPTKSTQSVIDGDDDNSRVLNEVAALVHGVSAGQERDAVREEAASIEVTERRSVEDTYAAPPLVQLPPWIQSMTGREAEDCDDADAGANTLRKRQSSD